MVAKGEINSAVNQKKEKHLNKQDFSESYIHTYVQRKIEKEQPNKRVNVFLLLR